MQAKSKQTKIRNNTYEKMSQNLKELYKKDTELYNKTLAKGNPAFIAKLQSDPIYKKKISDIHSKASTEFWSTKDAEYKSNFGKICREAKTEEGLSKLSEMNAGYNNPDFKKRWGPLYEKDHELISNLLLYTNLSDKFAISSIKPNVKFPRILNYYTYKGYLPKVIEKRMDKGFTSYSERGLGGSHKSSGTLKTVFSKELKYDFVFYFKDFFDSINELILMFTDTTISDSMLIQGDTKIANYKNKLEYFESLGIFKNKKIETILVDLKRNNKYYKRKSSKTTYDVDYKNLNKILIDKEYNEYGIDDNGKVFQKGKFRCSFNGKEYIL